MIRKKKGNNKGGDGGQPGSEAERAGRTDQSAQIKDSDPAKRVHDLLSNPSEINKREDELRAMQAELEASREKYHNLYDTAPFGYFSISEKGIILEVNITGANLFGAVPRDLCAHQFAGFIYKEDKDIYSLHRQQLFDTLLPQVCEMRMVRKDGSLFWVRIEAAMEKNSQTGKPLCHAVMSDITIHRQAEEKMGHSERLLNNIIEESPTAMWISDSSGTLIKLNQSCRELLNIMDDEVVGKYNIFQDNLVEEQGFMPLVHNVFEKGATVKFLLKYDSKQLKKLQLARNTFVILEVTISAVKDAGGKITNAVIQQIDITKRKQEEEKKELSLKIMGLLNKTGDQKDLVGEILLLIKEFSGCEAVGIRLREGDDYPYYQTSGFIPGHIERENCLRTYGKDGKVITDFKGDPVLECMCGNIIRGRFDPELRFFTQGGSFWTNSTTELLASTAEEDCQAHTPNRCNGEGYESVALVPLRGEGGHIGLLQLNDTRRDRFTPDIITFYEGIANSIGIVLARKQAEDALRDSEEKYRLLADNTADGVWLLDMDLKLLYCSPASAKQSGFTIEEIMGMPLEQYFTLASLKVISEAFLQIMPRVEADPDYNEVLTLELEFNKKDGTAFWAECKFSIIRNEGGKPVSIIGQARDISERKLADKRIRESENLYRSLIETSPDAIGLMDLNGTIIMHNKRALEVFGFELTEDLSGKNIMDMVAMENASAILANLEKLQGMEVIRNWEITSYKKDGSPFNLELSSSMLFDDDGKPKSIMTVFKDITERILVNSALRDSEEKYRNLFENAMEAIFVAREGKIVFFNPGSINMMGYSAEDLMGKPFIEFIHPDDREMVIDRHMRRLKGEMLPQRYEFRIIQNDGGIRWVELSAVLITWEGGPATLNFLEDITDRKLAHEALLESEERFRNSLEHAPDAVYLNDLEGNFLYGNRRCEEITGYRRDELLGKNLLELNLLYESSLARASEILKDNANGKSTGPDELELIRKDGRHIPVEINTSVLQRKGQSVVLAFARDVSERRQAEEVLQESEQKYRSLVTQSPDGIFIVNLDGTFLSVNRSMCDSLKYSEEELLSMSIWDIVPGQYVELHKKRIADIVMGKAPNGAAEYIVRGKDGNVRYVEILSAPYYESKKLIGFQGIARDITERKQKDEALKASEDKYRILFQSASVGISIVQDGRFKLVNPKLAELLGCSGEEILSMSVLKFIYSDDRGFVMEHERRRLSGEEIESAYQFRAVNKSGDIRWVEISTVLIEWEGKPATLDYYSDVTERKQAERKIRESELLYRNLVETSPDGIGLMDLNGNVIMYNQQAVQIFGFEPAEDLRGRNILDMVAPQHYESSIKNAEKLVKSGTIKNWAVVSHKKDGQPFWVEINTSMLTDEEGKPQSIMTVFRDITERKMTEEKLEKSYGDLKKTIDDTVIAMSRVVEMKDPYTAGHQLRVALLAAAIAREMKMPEEQVEYLNMAATIHDIGKIYVPSDILSKPGRLNPIEFAMIKTHARGAFDILKDIGFTGPVAQIAYQHHERMDGSGYPQGLKGNEMLLEAKVLAVADVVEAMASHRPYRPALGIDEAMKEISKKKGILFDPVAVDACLELFKSGRFAFPPVE